MENDISDIMLMISQQEFSEYDGLSEHRFSKGFQRRMERLISSQTGFVPSKVKAPIKVRVRVALIAALVAVIALCGSTVMRSNFYLSSQKEQGYMGVFHEEESTALDVMTEFYMPVLPAEYRYVKYDSMISDKSTYLVFRSKGRTVTFWQVPKNDFSVLFERSHFTVQPSQDEDIMTAYNEDGTLMCVMYSDDKYAYCIDGPTDVISAVDIGRHINFQP
ncbi:MAG: hypothetical protein IJO91_03655 [Oscillospiraceae bacterium]|nr:hypothetical protein [Oscillospiraceae bacterium]